MCLSIVIALFRRVFSSFRTNESDDRVLTSALMSIVEVLIAHWNTFCMYKSLLSAPAMAAAAAAMMMTAK